MDNQINVSLQNAIKHIQHECYNDALSSIYEAIDHIESLQAALKECTEDWPDYYLNNCSDSTIAIIKEINK